MIQKIAHLADIHIQKSIRRHDEYRQVFNNLIKELRTDTPDRIVIVGDLFDDYNKIEGELLVLVTKFLNALTKISPVIITRGNHDVLKTSANRIDSIQAIVESIVNPRITYYNTTGMFNDENIVWCVWKHGEKRNNPWHKDYIRDQSKIYIDLFHDPINGCVDANGFEFESKTYRSIADFKGDYSFFGDIHKHQYFADETKAYSSSLIAQNFAEGDSEFHGYILWDIINKTHKNVTINNVHNFHTVAVNRFTDFDNLNIDIPNISVCPSIRVKWQTLPATRYPENERKLWKHLSEKYNPIALKHKNEFLEEKKIDAQTGSIIENITKTTVLHEVFTEYLRKMGHEDEIIDRVLHLDEIIESKLVVEQFTNIEWSILRFWGQNFRNIKTVDINWIDKDGIYQITGKNTAGKSSIIQLLTYILYGKSIETDSRKKFGDIRFVNNRNDAAVCEGGLVLESNGEYYGIKRTTSIIKNKEGDISKVLTVVNYYKLMSPTDTLELGVNVDSLNEEDRRVTQKRIDEIIGTYENFIRITLTTADTLNNILNTDNSVFLDSILMDAGLDIFDQRFKEFKEYKKKLIATNRITCNVEYEAGKINTLTSEIETDRKTIEVNENALMVINKSIVEKNELKTVQLRKLHKIDSDILGYDISKIETIISKLNDEIVKLNSQQTEIEKSIANLKSTYDDKKLQDLILKRDNHKSEEFKLRTEINTIKITIEQSISAQNKLNGDVELLKRDGKSKKDEIAKLNSSKSCPTCGREKNEESLIAIQKIIKSLEEEMFRLAEQIKTKSNDKTIQISIDSFKENIKAIEKTIAEKSIGFELITVEIGKLINEKQEVENREKLIVELSNYPVKIENLHLKISAEQDKIKKYLELQDKIVENKSLEITINGLEAELGSLKTNADTSLATNNGLKSNIQFKEREIITKQEIIRKFNEQEKNDRVMDIYMECVHRDGVPTQILTNHLLPKINNTLSDLLQPVDFNVWLDESDLKLKMSYATHPTSIIECLGGSGKERTFSSMSLKVALNEINIKSKPSIFMLDEIMGKLKEESVDEFIQFMKIIKTKMKKLIIIEQNHEVHPDYVISANVDSNKISTITFED